MRPEKAERLLVWWASVFCDKGDIHGYSDHAAFVDTGSRSSEFKSKPLVHGSITDEWRQFNSILQAGLSPRQYVIAKFAYAPVRADNGRFICNRVRAGAFAELSGTECSLRTLERVKSVVRKLVMVNERHIYPYHAQSA